jgi:hypothetical protein
VRTVLERVRNPEHFSGLLFSFVTWRVAFYRPELELYQNEEGPNGWGEEVFFFLPKPKGDIVGFRCKAHTAEGRWTPERDLHAGWPACKDQACFFFKGKTNCLVIAGETIDNRSSVHGHKNFSFLSSQGPLLLT